MVGVQTIKNQCDFFLRCKIIKCHDRVFFEYLHSYLPLIAVTHPSWFLWLWMTLPFIERLLGWLWYIFSICKVLFFLGSSSLNSSSWNKIFRHVGGKQKEDNIIVWFRVRKWACEEERENARFDIARSKQHILISESAIQASSLYIMFGLQEPLLVDEWISCWAATYKETHVTSTHQKYLFVYNQK